MRDLSHFESANLRFLNGIGIKSALLFLTFTGLEKSILDATEPVRIFLRRNALHDYNVQGQGVLNKKELTAKLILQDKLLAVKVSLYRPQTKKGDPRIWPSQLNKYAAAGDILGLIILGSQLGLVNLTRTDLSKCISVSSEIAALFSQLRQEYDQTAVQLLARLREISALGPLKSIGFGDTAVGMTIENALGIPPNSNRAPDFFGIEIKSGRAKLSASRETRATLFACVPDWSLSRMKSSAEILNTFGYFRGAEFKLYCTVSAKNPNSQGLFLQVDEALGLLREMSKKNGNLEVAVWCLPRLESQFEKKHKETFWITARSEVVNGVEWFHLESVEHTRSPNLSQFHRLLADGGITVDHLIKRLQSGSTKEKGPLFKVTRARIPELFLGLPRVYCLKT